MWVHPGVLDAAVAHKILGRALEREFSLHDILKRPEVSYTDLAQFAKFGTAVSEDERTTEQVAIQIKYAGYIKRQELEVGKHAYLDEIRIPQHVDYSKISGLSAEVVQKLNKLRPENIGQASRVSGITPAAISLLLVYHKKGFPVTAQPTSMLTVSPTQKSQSSCT